MKLNEFFHTLDLQVNEEIPSSGTYIHTPQGLTLRPAGDSIWDDDKNNPSEINVSKIEIGLTNDGPDDIYHFMGVYHDAGTWELYTDNGITEQLNKYLGLAPDSIDWSEQGEQEEDMMHFDIASDEIVKTLITSGKFKMTKGVKEDEGSDKEKWLRYAKFWKYIRDIMAQEADADIADGFISADSVDEEPSYVTAKEMMQTAMAKQDTPWNDAIINSDLREYKHQISDNDRYTENTNFGMMKKAAIEMITTGKTQIVPYRGYPPMDQMDYSAEDTTDEDINDIVRLSGIK